MQEKTTYQFRSSNTMSHMTSTKQTVEETITDHRAPEKKALLVSGTHNKQSLAENL